jgi:hypothetical protein
VTSSKRARAAILIALPVVVSIVGFTGRSERASLAPPACLTSDGSTLFLIKQIVSSTDTALGVDPRQYDSLPNLPADSVTILTDTTLCRRAAVALGRNLRVPDTTTLRTVSVIRAGATRYVVTDTTMHTGEWGVHFVFDSTLTHRYVGILY